MGMRNTNDPPDHLAGARSTWMPGDTNPGHDCAGLVILDVGGPMDPGCTMRTSAYYYGGAWYIDREHRTKVDDIPILAWMEVPAWERAEKEDE